MKQKLFIILFSVIFFSQGYAQKWALPSSKWKYIVYGMYGGRDSITWAVEKDTLVQGTNCKKITSSSAPTDVIYSYLSGDTVYIMRPFVFGLSPSNFFLPYYFFGAHAGDHIVMYNIDDGCGAEPDDVVDSVQTIYMGGDTFNAFWLSRNGYTTGYRYIERIGGYSNSFSYPDNYIYPHYNCFDEVNYRLCNYGDSTIAGFWLFPSDNCSNIMNPPSVFIFPWDTSICSGQVVLRAVTNMPGGTFNWWPVSGTDSFIIVSPDSTQMYHVSYTLHGITDSNVAIVHAYTTPEADAGADRSYCVNGNAIDTLGGSPSASGGSGYYHYHWQVLNASATSLSNYFSSNPLMTAHNFGTFDFYLTVTDSLSSCKVSDTISIVVKPQPNIFLAASSSTICITQNDTITASAQPNGGIYHWNSYPDTSQVLIIKDSARTIIVQYDLNGCFSSATIEIAPDTICLTGSVDIIREGYFSIFPNPSSGLLVIHTSSGFYSPSITDILGKKMPCSQTPDGIDISEYANGIYWLELKTEYGETVKKKIIKN